MRYNAKKTMGYEGAVFVSNAAATPGETTLAAFITDAADGEIAIFNEAGTKVTGALVVGTKYQIVQKTSTGVKRTNLFKYTGATHKDYNAGTKHAAVITAPSEVAKGDTLSVTVIETTPFTNPLPQWEYSATAGGTSVADLLSAVAAQINLATSVQNSAADAMVSAQLISSQSSYAEFDANPSFTKGSKKVTFAGNDKTHGAGNDVASVGDFIYVKGEVYKVAQVNANDYILDRPYADESATIDVLTASGANSAGVILAANIGTLTLKLTAKEVDVHFRVGVSVESAGVEEALSVSYTNFIKSVGRPEFVKDWELEGAVWEGYRTLNVAFGPEFGIPDMYTNPSNTYQVFTIFFENEQKSVAAPIEKDFHKGIVTVFLLDSSTQWDTQFGL